MSGWIQRVFSTSEDRIETLIIGGTGTLGQAMLSLIGNNPKYNVTVISRNEHKHKELAKTWPLVKFLPADVRDEESLDRHFLGKNIVFHFAAMKHVDTAELNPEECLKINLHGSLNVANCALRHNLQYAVLSSTDKAVLPINTYGMTKALAEKYFFYLNTIQSMTKFSVFRWGNVLGSQGSVLHDFIRTLKAEKTVYVTHPEMTRFWIDIHDAANFMLNSYEEAFADRPMIPQMKCAKVLDLAKACAENLGIRDYQVKISGIRAGEKIHEVLLSTHEYCMRSDQWHVLTGEELTAMVEKVI